LNDQCLGTGIGASKKSAEQAAAQQAYLNFIASQVFP
ncbi:MAG: putative dsRNA-binding protein, partial [Synechocystis sp.]